MKKLIRTLATLGLALFAIGPSTLLASDINDTEAVEKVGIFVRGLKICHQHEWRNLTIDLEYGSEVGSGAMNVQSIKNHIRTFLEEYSNPDDFWEIMNTNLVHSLRKTFPDLTSMQSTLSLAPDRMLAFPRKSIVRYERGLDALHESFTFTKLNYLICQESFRALNLQVTWDMKENPDRFDHPDYQWVDEAMNNYFAEHPISFSKWKDLKPELETYLLEQFPNVTSMNVDITVVE